MTLSRLSLAFRALRQLGLRPLALYALYRFGLWTGHYRRATEVGRPPTAEDGPLTAENKLSSAAVGGRRLAVTVLLPLPSQEALAAVLGPQAGEVLSEADEVVAGKVRLFGAEPVPLDLKGQGLLEHWTVYERAGRVACASGPVPDWIPWEGVGDIKFTWEPGRFGWVYPLGRAYRLSGEEGYARAFWEISELFLEANPPNLGPHWASAQEVALRLIALVFAGQVFNSSPQTTPRQAERLAQAVAGHAARIPVTLVYARSQNNNHLLVEAAGLYTAGVFLPHHPSARLWRSLGWRWLHWGLQSQIAPDGAYTQNSTNYHRVMLQAALWAWRVANVAGQAFPPASLDRLAAAARWLLALADPASGQVPNLGPNDGAYLFPLAACPFADFRPVLQAAGQAFLGFRPFREGPWDEMGLWLRDNGEGIGEREVGEHTGALPPRPYPLSPFPLSSTPHLLRSPSSASWAYLRVARHTSRPGHADPLHLDLWWRGLNVAQDAGTYLYNGAPPWENALSSAFVHNTLTVDGLEPMRRAGRFLWLDWAQGEVVEGEPGEEGSWRRILAQHNGYQPLGLIHQRQVSAGQGGDWTVEDRLVPQKPASAGRSYTARLHWLLPDWPWEMEENGKTGARIRVQSPYGWIAIQVTPSDPSLVLVPQLVRGGELVFGQGPASPTWGWFSPTYGHKNPALSFAVLGQGSVPLRLTTRWEFPDP